MNTPPVKDSALKSWLESIDKNKLDDKAFEAALERGDVGAMSAALEAVAPEPAPDANKLREYLELTCRAQALYLELQDHSRKLGGISNYEPKYAALSDVPAHSEDFVENDPSFAQHSAGEQEKIKRETRGLLLFQADFSAALKTLG
jgi:hypothetical protein